MDFSTWISKDRDKQQDRIEHLRSALTKSPPGTLIINESGKRRQWFVREEKTGIRHYLPRKDQQKARSLAIKKALLLELQMAQNQLDADDAYLLAIDSKKQHEWEKLQVSPAYAPLLGERRTFPLSVELAQWMGEDYPRNPSRPEGLQIEAVPGVYVRSKSEAMILQCLDRAGIPYRYESLLTIGGTSVYPDFTIRHPETGQTRIWEHFGMCSKPDYLNHCQKKLAKYLSAGYIPTINMMVTWEDDKHPLSMEHVRYIIDRFLYAKER